MVNKKLAQKMLVDSGSDFTIIPYLVGLELGFSVQPEELRKKGWGVSGSFAFIEREVDCTLNKYSFKLPIAWMQDKKSSDFILGREVVFDLFDIEFKQKDEDVIFKWRG